MATTDPASPLPAAIASRGSQSKLSPALLFIVLAALLFRLVTAVTDRPAQEGGKDSEAKHGPPPLVRWVPLEKAAAAARAAGKPALYDFTAEWCPPCHRLDEEGWSDASLAGIANRGFVPARVMDREREDGKNPPLIQELQHKYNVESFPTLIVAGADGTEIARMEGWGGKDALETFLKGAQAKAR